MTEAIGFGVSGLLVGLSIGSSVVYRFCDKNKDAREALEFQRGISAHFLKQLDEANVEILRSKNEMRAIIEATRESSK